MFGYFYNESMRRMTIAFGQLFNNIQIKRKDSTDTVVQSIRVPLAYAPKVLNRLFKMGICFIMSSLGANG